MYLEPVELRDYIASQLTTPQKLAGSVELSENGLVFKSTEKENNVFTVPKQSIQSVATDERKYYSVSEVLGYGVVYLIYQYYTSHSHVLIVQTADEILEFEISEQQKEEAANFIEFSEEL